MALYVTWKALKYADFMKMTSRLHFEGLQQTASMITDPDARKNLDRDLQDIKKEYLDNKGEFFVATIDDAVVGIGALRKKDEEIAEIKRMRVTPTFQGKHIGSLILDQLIKRAKKLGYKKLILDTAINQKVAQKLYESRGFKKTHRGQLFGQETVYYELKI